MVVLCLLCDISLGIRLHVDNSNYWSREVVSSRNSPSLVEASLVVPVVYIYIHTAVSNRLYTIYVYIYNIYPKVFTYNTHHMYSYIYIYICILRGFSISRIVLLILHRTQGNFDPRTVPFLPRVRRASVCASAGGFRGVGKMLACVLSCARMCISRGGAGG